LPKRNSSCTHDADERRIHGTLAQVHLWIEADSTTRGVTTVVQIAFAQHLSADFTVLKTDTPSFLQGIFSQDIKLGHSEFDARFQVMGEHVEQVQALLRKPDLLTLLTDVGNRASVLEFTQQGLYAEFSGEMAKVPILEYFAKVASALSHGFFTQSVHTGAYR
jgi:hypothetical protein